ncbi:unnamed protein product [Lactuca virosa]|uniref:Uncharacterized protein n=1 Tax=Lactuca virosa TaxID=75947 RepID=A0AAU9M0G5_9ASTR|nr:unnamed protein product [Lactuca virosa]
MLGVQNNSSGSTSTLDALDTIKCNQVGVLERELSGHYVMNWIFDFVLNRQHGFPSRVGTLWNEKTAFEEKALVTTIATWAREFLKKFMNDGVV